MPGAAETMLMATGLLQPPDDTSALAARTVYGEVRDDLLAAIERDEPARMRACGVSGSYIDRLSKDPDYESWMVILQPLLGLAEAGRYQDLHQEARRILIDSYPGNSVDTLAGTRVQPPDPVKLELWLLAVDAIENQRIGYDLQACAVFPEQITMFSDVFPESYVELCDELRDAVTKKGKKWLEPWWLQGARRIFLKAPPAPPVLPPTAPPVEAERKVDLDLKALDPLS
jgi:hypothetical protein